MQAIVVDDQEEFASKLGSQIREREPDADVVSIPIGSQQSPRTIAAEVVRQSGSENAVVFINVNLKCKDGARQDQAGVEVLKFLRLTERFDGEGNDVRDAHCVLYSFQSIEQLLREKPSSLIICSDGVTFKQLPSDFAELDVRALSKDESEKAPVDDLDEFLRGEFTLPDERHSWANWWAARQMMKLYYFEKIHDASQNQVGRYGNLPAPSGIQPSVQSDEGTFSMTEVAEEVKNPQVRNALYLFDRSSVFENEIDDEDRSRIQEYRSEIKKSELKIGLIEDEAQEIKRNPSAESIGWKKVYSYVLLDNEYQVVDLLDEDNMNVDIEYSGGGVLNNLLRSIKEFNFDSYACIFLDLRLIEDSSNPEEVSDMSGVKVLERIRDAEPSIPIIMTTASNKLSSFFEISKTGADAYWVKQGVDERRTTREAIENYNRLLNLTSNALGEKYQFVRQFEKAVRELDDKPNPWWIDKEWRYCEVEEYKRTQVDKNDVIRVLYNSVTMLRTYISETQMKDVKKQSETFWVSAIIQQLSNIMERIHNLENGATFPLKPKHSFRRSEKPKNYRHDQIALYLMYLRHNASHQKGFEKFDFQDIAFYVEFLLVWLNNEKYAEGVRGTYSRGEWRGVKWFINNWSNDRRSDYSGYQLLRLYVSISWWLNKLEQNADNSLSEEDKNRLKTRLMKITRERVSFCRQNRDWEDVKSRFVDHDEELIDIEKELPEYLPT